MELHAQRCDGLFQLRLHPRERSDGEGFETDETLGSDRGMTLIRFNKPQPRIVELEDEGSFAIAMQQAADIRRNGKGPGDPRQIVTVVFQVSADKKTWHDVEIYWQGPWNATVDGSIPRPPLQDVIAVGRKYGAKYAQSQIRSVI